MKNLRVEFDIPTVLASHVGLDVENASEKVRQILALYLYEHQRISLGKACEMGGISQWEFSELNSQWGISMSYSQEDFKEDMERLSDV